MINNENLYKMAVIGFCNAYPSLENGMNPANIQLKACVDNKYIYQIKGNKRLVIEAKYDKETKKVQVQACEFPMDVDFEQLM